MAKPRPTDAEFDELKRKRDEGVAAEIKALREKYGWGENDVSIHASHAGECYCACPDGPCQHIWDGPDYEEERMISVTCSRCGEVAMYHDVRTCDF